MSQTSTVKPVAVVSISNPSGFVTINPRNQLQVGISAEFPSGQLSGVNLDHQSFFDFLLAGEEASEKVPQERFNIDGLDNFHTYPSSNL